MNTEIKFEAFFMLGERPVKWRFWALDVKSAFSAVRNKFPEAHDIVIKVYRPKAM